MYLPSHRGVRCIYLAVYRCIEESQKGLEEETIGVLGPGVCSVMIFFVQIFFFNRCAV